jgi:hypothetical protein
MKALGPDIFVARFSHTSPVYLDLATPATAAEGAKFFLEWIDREMRFYEAWPGFRREADRPAMLDLFARARAVYERMTRSTANRFAWLG